MKYDRLTACMRFKKKCVNNFQRLHFFFHPNFASSIENNKEVDETSHTRKRYEKFRFAQFFITCADLRKWRSKTSHNSEYAALRPNFFLFYLRYATIKTEETSQIRARCAKCMFSFWATPWLKKESNFVFFFI